MPWPDLLARTNVATEWTLKIALRRGSPVPRRIENLLLVYDRAFIESQSRRALAYEVQAMGTEKQHINKYLQSL